jgi:hypothetical protein
MFFSRGRIAGKRAKRHSGRDVSEAPETLVRET